MSQNRQYELVYIVTPDASEPAVADLHESVQNSRTRAPQRVIARCCVPA